MSEGPAKSGESWLRLKFTWVGLISLAAILGFIAAIAIPSYGDYTHRVQASETVSLMGQAKTSLAEYFQNMKRWPNRIDEVAHNTSGKYTLAVSITKGAGGTGEIELTGTLRTEGVDKRVAGTTILMISQDGGRNWICKPGTILGKNVSASCRN